MEYASLGTCFDSHVSTWRCYRCHLKIGRTHSIQPRQRMMLAMPRGGNWVVWPHFASYLGLINGKHGSQRNAELVDLHEDVHTNHFTVCGTLQRLGGQIAQDFAIASLEQDAVGYIERPRAKGGCRIDSRETGIVGHEYPLQSNRRTVFGSFGRRELTGVGNPQAVLELETDWLNLGGHVGYIVRRPTERKNLMRYRDQTKGAGRVPKLQEWFSLVGEADLAPVIDGDDWACVVTFLNQTPEETAVWSNRVRFDVDGDVGTCYLGPDTVRVDFAAWETRATETGRWPESL